MTQTPQPRVRPGTPTGGQFTTREHGEPTVGLDAWAPTPTHPPVPDVWATPVAEQETMLERMRADNATIWANAATTPVEPLPAVADAEPVDWATDSDLDADADYLAARAYDHD